MIFRFHPEAESELEDSVVYYESKREGLGLELLGEVHATIRRILQHPHAWTSISEGFRRCFVNRFPIGVIYSLMDDHVLIVAIMPLGREPSYWKGRR